MRLLLRYKEEIVSLGLLPVIAIMAVLPFFPVSAVLWCGLAVSVAALAYAAGRHRSLNFFLLQGITVAALCLLIKQVAGDSLLPDAKVGLTIELLMALCSFIHLTAPENYSRFQQRFGMKSHVTYRLEAGIIVVLSSLHLLTRAMTGAVSIALDYGIPVAIYALTLIVNAIGIRLALEESLTVNIVRIAPIVNGKLMLRKKMLQGNIESDARSYVWDLPIEGTTQGTPDNDERLAAKLISTEMPKPQMKPRLIMKYAATREGKRQMIELYVYPLRAEADLSMGNDSGYFCFDDIRHNVGQLSKTLIKELSQLEMAAEVWKQYYSEYGKESDT